LVVVKVGLLGPLTVLRDDGTLVDISAPKQRAVLTVLALEAGRSVDSAELIDAVWGDDPPRSVAKALQTYISALRGALGPGWIETEAGRYRLRISPDCVDLFVFERLLRDGSRAAEDGSLYKAVSCLDAALRLWRGPPIAELAEHPRGMAEAARLAELRYGAEEQLFDLRLSLGEHSEVIGDLEVAATEQPLRERRWKALMLALYRCERQADALRTYDRVRKILADQLGVDPSPGLQALELAILNHSPVLAPPAGFAAERLAASERPNNFRLQLSSFVGHEDDRARIAQALEGSRTVTLLGAGGVGKSRLAVEVARAALPGFDDGAWLVELASLGDPNLVAPAIMSVLGVPEDPNQEARDTLTHHLRHRQTLIVLDNCEHLIDECARISEHILVRCAAVKVLATSREPLRIPGEVCWRVRSLTPPAPQSSFDPAEQSEAVTLFTDRARSARPGFDVNMSNYEVVGEICRRLDGIPLAIELAAACVRTMSVEEVLAGLHDRYAILTSGYRTALPRQQTLSATISWGYDLLSELERIVFERMSVFGGSGTEAACRMVCGSGLVPADQVGSLLGRLVVRSMLNRDQVVTEGGERQFRYWMLESLREFGAERLAERGEAEDTRDRHLGWAIQFAESRPEYSEPSSHPDLIVEEHNLRSALEWARTTGDKTTALRLVGAAWFGHFSDRRLVMDQLLPPPPDVPPPIAAKALWAGVSLAMMMGDFELTARRAKWGAEAARAAGNDLLWTFSLCYGGVCLWALRRREEGLALAEEALRVAQGSAIRAAEARALFSLAWMRIGQDADLAEQTAQLALELADDIFMRGHIKECLGFIQLVNHDLGRAAIRLADAVSDFRHIQINCGAHVLEACAAWAAGAKRYELGAELLGAAERIRDETADRPRPWEAAVREEWLPRLAANLDPDTFEMARSRGRAADFEQVLDLAESALRRATGPVDIPS
jgi:predicted ATPase/DNA-binding SARP family transcriptional activator